MAMGAITDDILREAAEWAALLGADARDTDRAACEAWCRQDPRHRLVLERMRGLDASLAALDGAQRQVLRRTADEPQRGGRRRAMAALLVVAATAGVLSDPFGWRAQSVELRTAPGEQRNVTLPDRSSLLIDADSRLTARLDETTREIMVRRGRVLATVTSDRTRPFTVVTPDATATALGTSYLVRTGSASTRVTVVESAVRVCAGSGTCVDLSAGQTTLVSHGRILAVHSIDTEAALAWTRGWLEADDMSASEALEELAGHLPHGLHFDRADLEGLYVTGSYPLDRPRDALDAIAQTTGLAIVEGQEGALRVSRRR